MTPLRNGFFYAAACSFAIAVVFISGVPTVEAQPCGSDAGSGIATVRPQFTNTSITVPCGSLQIENGTTETSSLGQRTYDLTETEVRWGAFGKTEFNFIVPSYYNSPTANGSANGSANGASDTVIGMKQNLGPKHGFDFSLAPYLSLPTGSNQISSHGYDGGVQFPWSRVMSKNWTANGMFAVGWPTQSGRHNATGETTLYFDRQLTKTVDGWFEYAGFFPQRGGPQNIADFGLGYHPTLHQQLDIRYGRGMSAAAPDYFIGAGYSIRFQIHRAK